MPATDYEIFYVTRTMLESRPRNLEGWRMTDPGWYWNLEHTPEDFQGPFPTARQAAQDAEKA